jgi:gliding motility-associated-like protein
VITPNGDGFNDAWRIDGLADYPDHELYIVNRWESTVFETRGYRQNWTGEGLPDGTYFYLLRVRPAGTQERIYRGAITLLR